MYIQVACANAETCTHLRETRKGTLEVLVPIGSRGLDEKIELNEGLWEATFQRKTANMGCPCILTITQPKSTDDRSKVYTKNILQLLCSVKNNTSHVVISKCKVVNQSDIRIAADRINVPHNITSEGCLTLAAEKDVRIEALVKSPYVALISKNGVVHISSEGTLLTEELATSAKVKTTVLGRVCYRPRSHSTRKDDCLVLKPESICAVQTDIKVDAWESKIVEDFDATKYQSSNPPYLDAVGAATCQQNGELDGVEATAHQNNTETERTNDIELIADSRTNGDRNKPVQSSYAIQKTNTNEQSLVRVTINGDLHIGTHGTIGTDTRPIHTFSTDTLELEVTHNIYNYGLIGANRLVKICAGSIRSGREYEDETVQRYFSVIQKNRAGTAELDEVLEPATANDLHMAISRSDVEGVASLLSKGVDPNVALTGKTASELADEKLTPLFTTNHDRSEDTDRINDVASLIRSYAKRSGRIIAPSIVCNSMENVDDCSQLFGAHVELDAGGDLVVEEHSIWTSRIIVAKCGGSFIVRGTVKCQEIQSFEIGTNLLLEKGSKVFVGNGADISVANIFHNESILYNRRGLLNISTNVLRQNEDCKLGSCEKLRLEITRDSDNIHGSVEADVLFLCIAASVETHCEFISKQVCAVTITQHVTGNTCGRLTLQGPLEVQNGAFVAMNRNVKEYAGDDADIVVRSSLVCHGIYAAGVGFCVHSSSVIEILPVTGPTSTNVDREVNLSFRYLLTKAGSTIKFVADSGTRRIVVDSTHEWIHNGCMVVIKETDNMAIQTDCKVCKFIHRGELNNFDNIMFLIRDKLTNLRTISVRDSICMFGNGSLINEHGGIIQCDNGNIEIEGVCSIENKKSANIFGDFISITTRSGTKEQAEIQLIAEKTFDVSNKGVVKSQQDLIIKAGNIDNLGGVIESVLSSVQMGWSTRYKVTTIEGHVLTPELAVFTAYNSESFLLRCVGGQSSCENANVFCVPAAGIVAECLRGTIVVDTCIRGDSVCTVVARRGCSIMKSVEVPMFNVIPFHATPTELHKALDGDVREYNDDVDLGDDILQLRLPVTTYNEPWHDRKSFLLNITNPITLIFDEMNFKSSAPQSQIIMRTNNGQIMCKNLLFADNCLVIDGDIELSPICEVTAEALVCSPNAKCSIGSIDGPGEDMLRVFVNADQYVRLHGSITGATNQQQTVHIYCQEGDVQNSGTIELANLIVAASATSSMQLSGEINISGMLWLAGATDILLLDNCDIHCTTFACKPLTGDNKSKQSNLSINSGCLHIAGNTDCKIETFSVCPDGSINVCTDQCQDEFIIEVNKTASISGRLDCHMEGLFHLECNDTLALTNLRATIRSQNCTLMAIKSVHIDRGSEINVISGKLTITTAAENQKEINGNVTVLGQIKGSVVNETDADLSCDASYCVLDIQACDASFEGSLIQGFDRTDLFAAIQLSVDTNSMLTGGTKLEIDCKTFDHQGVIDQYKVVDIKVWNTLIVGRIQNCVEIELLAEMATVNNGEISGKRTAIVSPVYLNCPPVTGDKPIACGRAVPCLGTDGQQELIVEGLLCIVVGSHLQSRNINIKSVMRFDFATKTSTVPSRDDLKNWKSVSDSHLSKLANGTADTDVGTLVREAVHLPKVICNLGVASCLCNDIVATSRKIQSTGLAAFNVNDLTSCLNKAHTQYSSISSLNIKLNISKKFRKIKTATKHMARELMEKLLPASFSSSQIFRTNDGTEAIDEGIETTSFVHTGESTEIQTATNIAAISLEFNNQKGIWKNEGHVEACGDIMVSAKEISQVGKNGNVMRALHGAITLLGQDITAKGLVSMDLMVGGNGKVDVQNAVVSDGTQIVGDTVIVKYLRSKNLMVEGKCDVTMEDTAVADSTYIKGDKVTAKDLNSNNIMVEGKCNVDVENANVTGDTHIMGDKVTAKHMKSSNLMVEGKGDVTMEDTAVADSTYIMGDKVTAKRVHSKNLMVEGKGNVDVENTNVTGDTHINGDKVTAKHVHSNNLMVEGKGNVDVEDTNVNGDTQIKGDKVTAKHVHSKNLMVEGKGNVDVENTNVTEDTQIKGDKVTAKHVHSKNLMVEGKGNVDVEDTNVTGDTQIMGDKVTAKHIKSSKLMVTGKGNVTLEDTDVANSTQIKGDTVTATHLKSTNLMVEGKCDVDVEDTAVTEHTQIHCKGNVVVTSLMSQSATIEGSKSASLQTSKVGVANITAKENITVDDIDSNTLYMETDGNINMGRANVIEDLSAKSKGGNVQLDAKVKAKNAYLEAKHGDIDLLGRGGKAKHEFGSVQITTNSFNDIYSLLDKSGAYEDIKISERLGLAVDDQQVVLSHLRKQAHSVSIEAASIDVATDFTSAKSIHLKSASGLRVHSGAHVEVGNDLSLMAKSNIIIDQSARTVGQNDVYMESEEGSINVIHASVHGGRSVGMKAKEDVNIKAVTDHGPGKNSCITAGSGNEESELPAIYIDAGRDLNVHASDMHSSGKNRFVAGRDINITAHTYTTKKRRTKSSWLRLVKTTTVENTGHVDKSCISGEMNCFKAGGKFTSTAGSFESQLGNIIHAKGKVYMNDIVTKTVTNTNTQVLGGLLCNSDGHSSRESSHGTSIVDYFVAANSCVISLESDIEWTGSSVKTPGNIAEKAARGKIVHSRRILENEESSVTSGFYASETRKIGYRAQWDNSSYQTKCSSSMEVGGSYLAEAKELHMLRSFGVDVKEDMTLDVRKVTFQGAELKSSSHEHHVDVGLEGKSLQVGYVYSQQESTENTALQLDVGGTVTFKNVKEGTLDSCTADVGSMKGRVDDMKMITRADTRSHFGSDVSVGFDVTTCIPDHAGFQLGVGSSTKVNQQTGIRVRDGSHGLSVGNLSLNGAAMNFDGDVHKFANTIVTEDVNEMDTNFVLGIDIGKPKPKQVNAGLSVGLAHSSGRYQSCISSWTGKIDKSISQRVITDQSACRTVDIDINLNANMNVISKTGKQGKRTLNVLGGMTIKGKCGPLSGEITGHVSTSKTKSNGWTTKSSGGFISASIKHPSKGRELSAGMDIISIKQSSGKQSRSLRGMTIKGKCGPVSGEMTGHVSTSKTKSNAWKTKSSGVSISASIKHPSNGRELSAGMDIISIKQSSGKQSRSLRGMTIKGKGGPVTGAMTGHISTSKTKSDAWETKSSGGSISASIKHPSTGRELSAGMDIISIKQSSGKQSRSLRDMKIKGKCGPVSGEMTGHVSTSKTKSDAWETKSSGGSISASIKHPSTGRELSAGMDIISIKQSSVKQSRSLRGMTIKGNCGPVSGAMTGHVSTSKTKSDAWETKSSGGSISASIKHPSTGRELSAGMDLISIKQSSVKQSRSLRGMTIKGNCGPVSGAMTGHVSTSKTKSDAWETKSSGGSISASIKHPSTGRELSAGMDIISIKQSSGKQSRSLRDMKIKGKCGPVSGAMTGQVSTSKTKSDGWKTKSSGGSISASIKHPSNGRELSAGMDIMSIKQSSGKQSRSLRGMTIKGNCGPVSGAMTGHVSTSKTKSDGWKTKSSGGSISASIKHPSNGRELSAGMDIISIKQSSGKQSRSLRGMTIKGKCGPVSGAMTGHVSTSTTKSDGWKTKSSGGSICASIKHPSNGRELSAGMDIISIKQSSGKQSRSLRGMTIKGKCGPVSGAMTGHVSTSKTKSNAWKTKSSGGSISASIKHPSKGRELSAGMDIISIKQSSGKQSRSLRCMTIKGKCGPVSGAMTGQVSTSKTKSDGWKTKSSGGSISASIKHPSNGRELSAGMDIISIKQSSGKQSRSLRGMTIKGKCGPVSGAMTGHVSTSTTKSDGWKTKSSGGSICASIKHPSNGRELSAGMDIISIKQSSGKQSRSLRGMTIKGKCGPVSGAMTGHVSTSKTKSNAWKTKSSGGSISASIKHPSKGRELSAGMDIISIKQSSGKQSRSLRCMTIKGKCGPVSGAMTGQVSTSKTKSDGWKTKSSGGSISASIKHSSKGRELSAGMDIISIKQSSGKESRSLRGMTIKGTCGPVSGAMTGHVSTSKTKSDGLKTKSSGGSISASIKHPSKGRELSAGMEIISIKQSSGKQSRSLRGMTIKGKCGPVSGAMTGHVSTSKTKSNGWKTKSSGGSISASIKHPSKGRELSAGMDIISIKQSSGKQSRCLRGMTIKGKCGPVSGAMTGHVSTSKTKSNALKTKSSCGSISASIKHTGKGRELSAGMDIISIKQSSGKQSRSLRGMTIKGKCGPVTGAMTGHVSTSKTKSDGWKTKSSGGSISASIKHPSKGRELSAGMDIISIKQSSGKQSSSMRGMTITGKCGPVSGAMTGHVSTSNTKSNAWQTKSAGGSISASMKHPSKGRELSAGMDIISIKQSSGKQSRSLRGMTIKGKCGPVSGAMTGQVSTSKTKSDGWKTTSSGGSISASIKHPSKGRELSAGMDIISIKQSSGKQSRSLRGMTINGKCGPVSGAMTGHISTSKTKRNAWKTKSFGGSISASIEHPSKGRELSAGMDIISIKQSSGKQSRSLRGMTIKGKCGPVSGAMTGHVSTSKTKSNGWKTKSSGGSISASIKHPSKGRELSAGMDIISIKQSSGKQSRSLRGMTIKGKCGPVSGAMTGHVSTSKTKSNAWKTKSSGGSISASIKHPSKGRELSAGMDIISIKQSSGKQSRSLRGMTIKGKCGPVSGAMTGQVSTSKTKSNGWKTKSSGGSISASIKHPSKGRELSAGMDIISIKQSSVKQSRSLRGMTIKGKCGPVSGAMTGHVSISKTKSNGWKTKSSGGSISASIKHPSKGRELSAGMDIISIKQSSVKQSRSLRGMTIKGKCGPVSGAMTGQVSTSKTKSDGWKTKSSGGSISASIEHPSKGRELSAGMDIISIKQSSGKQSRSLRGACLMPAAGDIIPKVGKKSIGDMVRHLGVKTSRDVIRKVKETAASEVIRKGGENAVGDVMRKVGEKAAGEVMRKVVENAVAVGHVIRKVGENAVGDVIHNVGENAVGEVIRKVGGKAVGDVIRKVGENAVGDVIRKVGENAVGDVIRNVGENEVGDAIRKVGVNAVGDVIRKVGEYAVGDIICKVGENAVGDVIRNVGETAGREVLRKAGENAFGDVIRTVGENDGGDVIRKVGENAVGDVIRKVGENAVCDVIRNVGENAVGDVIHNVGENAVDDVIHNVGDNALVT